MGLFGPPNIEKLIAKGDVSGLIKALSYRKDYWAAKPSSQMKYLSGKALDRYNQDGQIRKRAAIALGQIGNARAIPALVETLKNGRVGEAAVAALVRIGTPAVDPLILSLKNDIPFVRANAARALGQIRDGRAVDPLVACLKDPDLGVRIETARALEKLGWQPGMDENGAAYWAGLQKWERCVAIGSLALEPLLTTLKGNNDWQLRIKIINALGEIGDQGAAEPLIAILQQNDWNLRLAVVAALGRIGAGLDSPALRTQILTVLTNALKKQHGISDDELHKAAVVAFGQIKDPQAVEQLKAALKGNNGGIRLAAAEALDKLGWQPAPDESGAAYWATRGNWEQCIKLGPIAVPALIKALTYGDGLTAQRGAIVALGEIGDFSAIPALVGTLVYQHANLVGEAAINVLARMGTPAVPKLVSALGDANDGFRNAAGAALVKIGLPAVQELIRQLNQPRPGAAAAEALFRIGQPAVGQLVTALFNPQASVREAAERILERLNWQPGQDESGAAFWASKHDWEKCVEIGPAAINGLILSLKDGNQSNVILGATSALVKIGSPAVNALVIALKDRSTRSSAVGSLEKIGQPGIEALVTLLQICNKEREARQAAAGILDRIGWKPGQDERAAAYWIAKEDWQACIGIGAPAVIPLSLALQDPYASVGKAAACTLGQIGDNRAVEALVAAMEDNDKSVRQAAASALGMIRDPRAIAQLGAALMDGKKWMWEAAAGALVQINDPRAVDPLVTALANENWSIRKTAAGALIQLYKSGALDEAHRQLVLAQSGRMASVHGDRTDHFTNNLSGDCGHVDYDKHTDNQGIGVPFQV